MIIVKKADYNNEMSSGCALTLHYNAGEPFGEHVIVLFPTDREYWTYMFLHKNDIDTKEYLISCIAGTGQAVDAILYDENAPEEVREYKFLDRLKILFTGKE